jgi:hypothetical protein
VVVQADRLHLLSDEHFTVDGTLLEAAASLTSFRARDEPPSDGGGSGSGGNPANRWVDFRGEKRSNATHQSRTDPDARLYKKGGGQAAKLCYVGHAAMENRHGLLVDFLVTTASGTAECAVVPSVMDDLRERRFHPETVGLDKGYDTRDLVAKLRAPDITPHVAQNTAGRRSAIDGRTTRHAGYAISQRIRMKVEEIFAWIKTVGGFPKRDTEVWRRSTSPAISWVPPTTWSVSHGSWPRRRRPEHPMPLTGYRPALSAGHPTRRICLKAGWSPLSRTSNTLPGLSKVRRSTPC